MQFCITKFSLVKKLKGFDAKNEVEFYNLGADHATILLNWQRETI